jgi:oxygen-independent coproporphyrinogen III oxidase
MNKDLLKKYNIPIPRYTSYPTVPNWTKTPSFVSWIDSLKMTSAVPEVDLYIHIPFCQSLCWYCGCNRVISKDSAKGTEYISYLKKEWQIYLDSFEKIKIKSIHFGGGTPNFLLQEDFISLMEFLQKNQVEPIECSIEIDPRTIDISYIEEISKLNLKHVSLGVQDFDENVQNAINRYQPYSVVEFVTVELRKRGLKSMNFDLIYGLPLQTTDTIKDTIEKVKTLMPEHIALYSYAHLPDKIKNQRLIKDSTIAQGAEKRVLYEHAKNMLLELDYVEIGLDHFARKSSVLAKSFIAKELKRSFMGYTAKKSSILIGLGVTAISENSKYFIQNTKEIDDYYLKLDRSESVMDKGHELSELDQFERDSIQMLMCNLSLSFKDFPLSYKELILPELEQLSKDGLIDIEDEVIDVTETGKMFLRNIASVFDSYFRHKNDNVVYSSSL